MHKGGRNANGQRLIYGTGAMISTSPWIWVVPESRTFVSGGNRYNESLMAALKSSGMEMFRSVPSPDFSGGLQNAVVLLDSLWMGALSGCLPDEGKLMILLAHMVSREQISWLAEAHPTLDGVVVPSSTSRDEWEACGWAPSSILVLEPGRESVPVLEPVPVRGPLRFLAVGNLVPEKGWLNTMAILQNRGVGADKVLIDIVGDDRIHPEYAGRVCQMSADWSHGCFRYLGPELPEIWWSRMGQYDAFFTCSPYESYGMAVGEALQGGLPVIGLEGGHLSRLVEKPRQGVLFRDAETLAEFLLQTDPMAFRARFRRPVAEAFRLSPPHWEHQARRLIAFVEARASGKRGQSGSSGSNGL